jgi:hypothetical protein
MQTLPTPRSPLNVVDVQQIKSALQVPTHDEVVFGPTYPLFITLRALRCFDGMGAMGVK